MVDAVAKSSRGRFLLFVYGTLKRGMPNAGQLGKDNGQAVFKGLGRTEESYPLTVASQYNIPFLLYKPGTGKAIKGEVYEVDDQMLKHCDDFEGHPDWYERKETSIYLLTNEKDEPLEQNKNLTCWCYFLKKYKPSLLDFPFLDSYENSPDKPYVERYLRDVNLRPQDN